jgi:hypothetical protein
MKSLPNVVDIYPDIMIRKVYDINAGNVSGIKKPLTRSPLRTIDPGRLMRSPAIMATMIHWHSNGNSFAFGQIKQLLSLNFQNSPRTKSIRQEVCSMNDREILIEADNILAKFHNAILFRNPSFSSKPSLVEFIEKNVPHYDLCQLLVHLLSLSNLIAPGTYMVNSREKSYKAVKEYFRQFLVLIFALEIISKEHDFTPLIKRVLVKDFPQIPLNEFIDAIADIRITKDTVEIGFNKTIAISSELFNKMLLTLKACGISNLTLGGS